MTTCARVRERLPEHVLGTLDEQDDAAVRRHLRGCGGCRAEMSALGEGMASFARAAHDEPPPEELEDRVLAVLDEEWRAEAEAEPARRRTLSWLAVAAVVAIVVLSVGFGLFQANRAASVADSANSYEQLLHILGGEEFRAGELHAAGSHPVEGSIVIYDSHVDQSWVVVFVRTSGLTGEAVATLHAADGSTIDTWPVEIDRDGDGAGWLVTSVDLASFDRVTLTGPDGQPLAAGEIGEL